MRVTENLYFEIFHAVAAVIFFSLLPKPPEINTAIVDRKIK